MQNNKAEILLNKHNLHTQQQKIWHNLLILKLFLLVKHIIYCQTPKGQKIKYDTFKKHKSIITVLPMTNVI